MRKIILANGWIVNEGRVEKGHLFIQEPYIEKIIFSEEEIFPDTHKGYEFIDVEGKYVLPGLIDDQVHFREPGLTHKGDIYTESVAAVAGGITSFLEMPNTMPQTTTRAALEEKIVLGEKKSLANFAFFFGATNDNISEIHRVDKTLVPGIKVFMGSSTGNMLVDDEQTLSRIFAESEQIVAVHSEDEKTIRENLEHYRKQYGDNIPVYCHPHIRSAQACFISTEKAIRLANHYNTRLHLLHLSTATELSLFEDAPLQEKRITAEVCVHHLWFTQEDYTTKGSLIKWNPAIKTRHDRDALREALHTNKIDLIATDHAPHTWEEKQRPYMQCPSGGPLVQHALNALYELVLDQKLTLPLVVQKYAHHPAILFGIEKRGYLKEGYYADVVVLNPGGSYQVDKSNIRYKCGWSPFEGYTFHSIVEYTFVNGYPVFWKGQVDESYRGKLLSFTR